MIENIINDIEDDDQQLFEHWKVQVDEGQTPVRIDKYLAEKIHTKVVIVSKMRLMRVLFK